MSAIYKGVIIAFYKLMVVKSRWVCAIIPVSLTDAADKVYRSILENVPNNYEQIQQDLCQIFNNDQLLWRFRESLTAQVRATQENIY